MKALFWFCNGIVFLRFVERYSHEYVVLFSFPAFLIVIYGAYKIAFGDWYD